MEEDGDSGFARARTRELEVLVLEEVFEPARLNHTLWFHERSRTGRGRSHGRR